MQPMATTRHDLYPRIRELLIDQFRMGFERFAVRAGATGDEERRASVAVVLDKLGEITQRIAQGVQRHPESIDAIVGGLFQIGE